MDDLQFIRRFWVLYPAVGLEEFLQNHEYFAQIADSILASSTYQELLRNASSEVACPKDPS
ncbi:hypothetical protein [Rahnella sp. ChDrAdgB13]|uniref:hypothetical protein n=1 Tax=Rahnella sp. ChDrAdgB13 TaxID=1850581 RepID=UPI001AD898ED|nr:hypothetical protein [Rahnella sp. ChDrAdgB13]